MGLNSFLRKFLGGEAESSLLRASRREIELGDFRKITLEGSLEAIWGQSERPFCVIDGTQEMINRVRVESVPDGLRIFLAEGESLAEGEKALIVLGSAQLSAVHVLGSGKFSAPRVEGDFFRGAVTGSGELLVSGKTKKAEMMVAGSGSITAECLEAEELDAVCTGCGDILAQASVKARARAAASGSVMVLGNPPVQERDETGSGSVSFRAAAWRPRG